MLKKYIISIISVSIAILIFDMLLPEGNVRKYGNFAFSLILSIALIQPITSFFKSDFNLDNNISKYEVDYTDAVKSTVNSISGFEDAEVSVEHNDNKIESITVYLNGEKLFEKAEEQLKKDFVKKMLSVVYGTENIYFSG